MTYIETTIAGMIVAAYIWAAMLAIALDGRLLQGDK
jgi:hypothetical protein